MNRADCIMNENDESAVQAIKILDSIKSELGAFTQAQKMKYTLLYHKAMNKAEITFTSDSTMLKVVDYYEHHGNPNDSLHISKKLNEFVYALTSKQKQVLLAIAKEGKTSSVMLQSFLQKYRLGASTVQVAIKVFRAKL